MVCLNYLISAEQAATGVDPARVETGETGKARGRGRRWTAGA